ncbi:MAG: fused MFS/spermidine synthase, partial [Planctomycetota bacterium]
MSLRTLALFCFFLSGATGLFYQVLWTRLLGSTIGNTHFSITVVVSVFMGGLAFGSFLGGRVADRSRNPLRLYGILNLVGALLCIAVPPASTLGEPLFRWVYQSYDGHPEATPLLILRIVFSALLILGPTICMGATLPALARYLTTKMSDVGFTVGRLYSVNTFGAVFGVFLAGFWAMEHLGLWGTTTLAVVIDVIIGALVIWVSRTETQEPSPEPEQTSDAANSAPAASLPGYVKLAVFAFFATGFGNMVLEIAWTKAIVQTIGNSTYAFSLIVTLFILGIGLGGGIMTLVVDRLKNLNLALGVVSSLTALCIAATVPILGRFPIWGARYFDAVEQPNYDTFLWIKIWMVAIAILPSTTLMGCVFPIVGKIRTRAIEKVGSAIGTAYFANTLGAILGTLSAGFLFIPVFGKVYYTIYLGAGISLAVGLLLILTASEVSTKRRGSLAAGLAAIVLIPHAFLLPHGVLGSTSSLWDPAILSKGAYVYYKGTYYLNRRTKEVVPVETLIEETRAGNEVLWYREGIHAPVVVVKNPTKGLAMRISGKVEASIPAEGGYNRDLPHQVMAGHLPMILHPDPKEVLTLGLGGG